MSSLDDTSHQLAQNFILNGNYNSSQWQPITFTLVEYPKGDLIGLLLAWMSLVPLGVGAGFLALMLFRRDLHTITFFGGILINELCNKILKYWIKEPRPLDRIHLENEYGMPSNHSQFICFFATYVTLFVLLRLHHMHNNAPYERAMRLLVLLGCWTVAFLVSFGRIYLQYHTMSQVIVGTVIGTFVGVVWFSITHLVLSPLFPYVVSWKISEFLLLRDTTLIPNIMWFEYTVTRQEARARSRKLSSMKSQ